MANNFLMNLNKNSIVILSKALDHYLDTVIKNQHSQNCYDWNTQPSATVEIMIASEENQAFRRDCEQVRLLRQQIAYAKKQLKVTE